MLYCFYDCTDLLGLGHRKYTARTKRLSLSFVCEREGETYVKNGLMISVWWVFILLCSNLHDCAEWLIESSYNGRELDATKLLYFPKVRKHICVVAYEVVRTKLLLLSTQRQPSFRSQPHVPRAPETKHTGFALCSEVPAATVDSSKFVVQWRCSVADFLYTTIPFLCSGKILNCNLDAKGCPSGDLVERYSTGSSSANMVRKLVFNWVLTYLWLKYIYFEG
jgi:hypothetical protein